ncbi:hypothetical protein OGAPHI_001951 [Ogataea philodendri]|uniref:TECPR1-like DysF domain-containing protein n=1 Tax=Ogataea philodendri TaxID=1378263 RepID=A0A9P8PAB7_9ASCO|nr:uncharacterized protein OGAPHI_001951 [Ogataea philodendri]KAH3668197.1 hypothetical protein OGAPHI_001951 [Ogataea philodendri]
MGNNFDKKKMSSSPPSSSSSDKAMSITRKLAVSAINGIQERSNDYIHNRKSERGQGEGRKRAALAAIISTVSSVGADKLARSEFGEYDNLTEQEMHDKVHFMDKLTNKLIDTIPQRSNESLEELRLRLDDKHRVDQPGLSITRISRNFKTLSSKMDIVFRLQYFVLRTISWDEPALTLTFLILYTWGCLMPYLFLVYPLIYVLTAILIPNYLYRHPIEKPDIIPTRQRGDKSIFGFLQTRNDWEKDRQQLLEERSRELERLLGQDLNLSTISSRNSTDSEDDTSSSLLYEAFTTDQKSNMVLKAVLESGDSTSDDKKPSGMMDKVKLLINMRDLQNLTSTLIKIMDKMEKSMYENCSFKDEKKSTKLFFNIVSLVIIAMVLGPYIPWRAIFIITLWVLLLLKHPSRGEVWKQFKPQKKRKLPPLKKASPKERFSWVTEIMVDDSPQYREVEIYEVEKQDIIESSVYQLFIYSPSIFNESNPSRLQKKRPDGTTNLAIVQPPTSSWKYTGNDWLVDRDVASWTLENGVSDEVDIRGEWAYDKSGEYRRRRLVREVVRISRPAKKRNLTKS